MSKIKALIAATISASVSAASMSVYADPVTLKLAHGYVADHYLWEHGVKLFTQAVETRTDNKVRFEVYPAGQLGKDNLSLLQYGVTDMALLIPSQQSDKFPMSTVAELPGMFSTSCEGARRMAAASGEGKIIDKLELEPNGVEPLFFFTLPHYSVLTSKRKVTSLKDFSGLKLRANGAALGETFRSLGVVPVQLGSTELYNSVTRGTVDGAYFPYMPLVNYSLEKHLRYSLEGLNLGSSSGIISISSRAWNKLDDDVKQIMREEAPLAQEALCAWMEQDMENMRNILVNDHGMEVTFPSEELLAAVNEKSESIISQWERRMKSAGLNGSEVLEAFNNDAN